MAENGQKLHYEGALEKAGKRFFEGFRRRWFILDGRNLSYYKAPETTPENLLGIIDLTKVKSVVPFKMINNNAFQIITSMRTYTFTAATHQLMTEWISVLRQAMQIESFNNRRGKSSIRASYEEDTGYELVSSPRSASSDQVSDAGNLYDQVVFQGTYESVGRQQGDDDYETANPSPERTDPPSTNLGSYGVIGESRVKTPINVADLYAKVDKKRSLSAENDSEDNEDTMYAQIGTAVAPKAPIATMNPMSIICESDDDDDDEEEKEEKSDDAFVDEELARLQADPLPTPKGDSYAVDQIKLLLKDFKRDDNMKVNQELNFEDIKESVLVPESCEKAFVKLKEFLNQLESK